MRLPAAGVVATLLTCALACGGSPEPPSTGGDPGSAIQITGNERLGWDQAASSQEELSSLQFRVYVDEVSNPMSDVRCGDLRAEGTAECSGRLPSLSAGRHMLTLTSVSAGGAESGRSSPIEVFVVRSVAAITDGSALLDGAESVGQGVRLQAVSDGLQEPTDLAVTPDRRILVAERLGNVRVVADGSLQARPAVTMEDVWAGDGGGLLGITLDADFANNHLVYAVYTTTDGFRVARFREAGGTLGERAILLDGVAASANASAALRFGPDGKLYVSFDDGGDAGRAGDLGSFNGKVLRVNPDGSVPSDQAGLTPVFVADVGAARGIDWTAGSHLWLAEGRTDGSGVLDAVIDEPRSGRRGRIATRYRLPDGRVPSGILAYRGELLKQWTGDLLVALPDAGQIVRLRFDPQDATKVVATEVVLELPARRIRALGIAPDGLVYLATDNQLLTLGPAPAGLDDP